LDISKIILGLVIPLWTGPTVEQQEVVANVRRLLTAQLFFRLLAHTSHSYLETLHAFCEVHRDRFLVNSEWKGMFEDVRLGIQEQLPFISVSGGSYAQDIASDHSRL
jgi:hypothetical protein